MTKIELSGEIVVEPTFNHESKGEKFFKMEIGVKRKSETVDYIPVIISEFFLNEETLKAGNMFHMMGEVRTHNWTDYKGKSHMSLFAFVKEVLENENRHINKFEADGYIVKCPNYRKTPLGKEVTDLLIASNRAFGRSDYIPCIAWNRNAIKSGNYKVGTKVQTTGRLHSREYKKYDEYGEHLLVTYEVSINMIDELIDKIEEENK